MIQVAVRDDGDKVNLCICIETQVGLGMLHLVQSHGLIAASIGTRDKDSTLYDWVSDIVPVKVTLLVLFNIYCILPAQDKVPVNKVAAVNLLVQYAERGRVCISLELEVTAEQV